MRAAAGAGRRLYQIYDVSGVGLAQAKAVRGLVDAGGLRIVIAYGGAVLHRPAPQRARDGAPVPCALRQKAVGYAALVLSVGVALPYLPGGPSALVWPYE